MESDLGGVAAEVERRSAALCGEGRWARHKEVVSAFWRSIADYLGQIEAGHIKIYQDGLPGGGELGRKIVEEGARRGSKNYEIILDLAKRGAEIMKTEDASLLKEEYERLNLLAEAGKSAGCSGSQGGYGLRKDSLTNRRDRFIARTINETLAEGELGILFIGAYHDLITHLAQDRILYICKHI